MSRSKKPRKAYRPRQIAINTLELAIHRAAKPPRQDLDEILEGLDAAIQALCAGVATELQWSIVAGAAALAKAIERQGVVRGLQEHLDSAEAVLQAVYRRCRLPALWLRPTLTFEEIEAVQLLRELHAFQIEQLGRGEFLRAVDAATRLIVSEGNQVTLMRDIEEVAA